MPDQNKQQLPDQIITPHLLKDPDTFFTAAIVTVTRPEEIPAALAQRQPVLIDIPAVQWGLRRLKTVQGWSGTLGWFIVKVIVTWLIIQWLNAQVPNTGLPFPDWAKLHLETHGDKVIVNPYIPSPHEE